jgi:general secretion pathway protein D
MTENNIATTPNTTIEFRSVGTSLLITPNINADRTVTLRLMQENSSINDAGVSIPVVTSSVIVQNVSVDVVASRTISGTFVVKDGLAAAIGGLIEEKKLDQRAQVLWIGRIPLLGFFFRNQTTEKARKELVIMIHPHVISTPANSEHISQDLLKDLMIRPFPRRKERWIHSNVPILTSWSGDEDSGSR